MTRKEHNQHHGASRRGDEQVSCNTLGMGELSQYDPDCVACWLGHAHTWDEHDANLLRAEVVDLDGEGFDGPERYAVREPRAFYGRTLDDEDPRDHVDWLRCPACGASGPAADFGDGCPNCGFEPTPCVHCGDPATHQVYMGRTPHDERWEDVCTSCSEGYKSERVQPIHHLCDVAQDEKEQCRSCGEREATMFGLCRGCRDARMAEMEAPSPGWPGEKPDHMDWSEWYAFNNID